MTGEIIHGLLLGIIFGVAIGATIGIITTHLTLNENCVIDGYIVASDLSLAEQHEIASWIQSSYPDKAKYSQVFQEPRVICCCPGSNGSDNMCCTAGGQTWIP